MLNLAINSVILSDENSFTTRYYEGNGTIQEHKKSIKDLIPNSASYQHQIRTIENAIDNKKKYDYLDFSNREVIDLCFEADELRQRKLKQENQAKHLIKNLAETNFKGKGKLYNRVVIKVINENIDSALLLLEEAELENVNSKQALNNNETVELLFLRARLLRIQNKFDEAVKSYENGLKLKSNWKLNIEVANFFKSLNYSAKAEHHYNESINKAETDAEKIVSLNNFALLLKSNYDFKRAEKLLAEALQLVEKSNKLKSKSELSKLGILLNTIGILWLEKNEFSKANRYFQEALRIRRLLAAYNSEMYLFHLTETLNNLGRLNKDLGKYIDARKFYDESLGIIDELLKNENDVIIFHLAKLLNGYGILEKRNNNPVKAKDLYLKSLKTFGNLPKVKQEVHKSFKSDTLRNLSVLQNDVDELDDAKQSLQVALKIYRELAEDEPKRYIPNVADALHTLGNNFTLDKKFIEAENSFKEALEIRKKFAELAPEIFEIPLASTYLCLGELYSFDTLDNEVLFLEYLTKSIELFEKYSDRNPFAKEWRDKAKYILETENSIISKPVLVEENGFLFVKYLNENESASPTDSKINLDNILEEVRNERIDKLLKPLK